MNSSSKQDNIFIYYTKNRQLSRLLRTIQKRKNSSPESLPAKDYCDTREEAI
uniref:Uncharacterized protein n=1 Tax=Meloidogyne enterolobii TaxID=390850 RepID=A0A6V7Y7L5_MELEN|nr:unnamed protein product [Meloidogyne enterolobii]